MPHNYISVVIYLLKIGGILMKLKRLEKLLKKVKGDYYASGRHNYRNYSISINDFDEEEDKKYVLTISTMRCVVLQYIYFNEALDVLQHLSDIKLKIEKEVWL